MPERLKSALLSSSAIALAALIAATPRQAMAECLPDPAMDGETVTCAASDFDGFTSGALDLTFIVNSSIFVEGSGVTLSGAGAVITNNGFVEALRNFVSGFSLLADNMTLTNAAGASIISGGVSGSQRSGGL